jgi:hypothetical protein
MRSDGNLLYEARTRNALHPSDINNERNPAIVNGDTTNIKDLSDSLLLLAFAGRSAHPDWRRLLKLHNIVVVCTPNAKQTVKNQAED